jgi:succinyl-diaminopimelate desuccinylase
VKRRAIEEGLIYEVRWPMPGDVRPYGYSPSEVSEEELGVKILKKCAELTGKREELIDGAPCCGEASWLQAWGTDIPTVYYGPGSVSACHTTEEAVDVDQIVQAAKVYALMALRFLSTPK